MIVVNMLILGLAVYGLIRIADDFHQWFNGRY